MTHTPTTRAHSTPPPATGAEELDPAVLADRAARHLTAYRFRPWFYGDSIGMEGLLAADDLTGTPAWGRWAAGFVRAWFASNPVGAGVHDATAPGRAICLLAEREHDPLLLEHARALAAHVTGRRRVRGVWVALERAPLQQPYGGGPLGEQDRVLLADPGAAFFIDCMHFDAPFLARLSHLTGEPHLLDLAVEQLTAYLSVLADAGTGLLRHFYLERTDTAYVAGWGRGQGWALLGLLDVLEDLPPSHPGRPGLVEAATRLITAMRRYQRLDGHWHALAHDPTSYVETSTAAFMAAAFLKAPRVGVLTGDQPTRTAADRALGAALQATDTDGRLHGVSHAVMCSTVPSRYAHVPTGLVSPWGQGPLLLALAEASTAPTTPRKEPG